MKTSMIINILLFIVGFVALANAYPVDNDGNAIIPEPTKQRCIAKGEVTLFVYKHRDTITIEQAFDVLIEDWNDAWSQNPNIPWATRVDMERIIRDAYRTDSSGEYIRECCTEEIADQQAVTEMRQCVYQLNY